MVFSVVAVQGSASFAILARLAEFARIRTGEGLRVAGCVEEFSGAVALGVLVVTSVAPRFSDAWAAHSGGLATWMEPNPVKLDQWWRRLGEADDSPRLREAG